MIKHTDTLILKCSFSKSSGKMTSVVKIWILNVGLVVNLYVGL